MVTTEALRYMTRTKQCRTYMYLPYTFPAVAGTHYRPREDGGLSKPSPGCKEQLVHGCYATARSQRTRTRDLAAAGRRATTSLYLAH